MFLVNHNFAPTIRRFSYKPTEIVSTSMRIALRSAQRQAVMEARQQLKAMVYTAPLPQSVVEGKYGPAGNYLARRRLGTVYKAIVASKIEQAGSGAAMAEVKVDKNAVRQGDETYYYAWILNRGSYAIKYSPRPFWREMVRIMRARLDVEGRLGLVAAKAYLLGDDTYGGLLYATGEDTVDEGI